jgi:hypothetical protein
MPQAVDRDRVRKRAGMDIAKPQFGGIKPMANRTVTNNPGNRGSQSSDTSTERSSTGAAPARVDDTAGDTAQPATGRENAGTQPVPTRSDNDQR